MQNSSYITLCQSVKNPTSLFLLLLAFLLFNPVAAAPLGKPILSSPTGEGDNAAPLLSWQPVPDAQEYLLWIKQGSTQWINQRFTASQSSCAATEATCTYQITNHSLHPGQKLRWRVRAYNASAKSR